MQVSHSIDMDYDSVYGINASSMYKCRILYLSIKILNQNTLVLSFRMTSVII